MNLRRGGRRRDGVFSSGVFLFRGFDRPCEASTGWTKLITVNCGVTQHQKKKNKTNKKIKKKIKKKKNFIIFN